MGQLVNSSVEWMRGILVAAKSALVASTEQGKLTGRVASSMTMVSKPRVLPSMAE